MAIDSQTVTTLLQELREIAKTVPLAQQLWDTGDIANWLKLSEHTVAKSVVTRLDFPVVFVPTEQKQGQKRWFAGEIIEWAQLHRGKMPQPRPRGRGRPRRIPQ